MASRPRRTPAGPPALKIALLALVLVVAALLSTVRRSLRGAWLARCRLSNSATGSPPRRRPRSTTPRATPVLLAELHGLENRDVLSGDQIPQVMRDAIVAVEDSRFYVHKGVDFVAILRAAWADLRHREVVASAARRSLSSSSRTPFVVDEQSSQNATCGGRHWPTVGESVVQGEDPQRVPQRRSTSVPVRTASRRPRAPTSAWTPKTSPSRRPRFWPACRRRRRPIPPDRTRSRDRPARPGAQQDVSAALHQTANQLQGALAAPLQLAAAGAYGRGQGTVLGGIGAGATGGPLRVVTVLGGGLRVYTSLDPGRCSRLPKKPSRRS